MGVTYNQFLDSYTPACSECGIHLCWDISTYDYDEDEEFWDKWICKECNNGVALKRNKHELERR
jgi:hypothetical protein